MESKSAQLKQYIISQLQKKRDIPISGLEKQLGFMPAERTIRNVKNALVLEGYPLHSRISDKTIHYDPSVNCQNHSQPSLPPIKQADLRRAFLIISLSALQQNHVDLDYIPQDLLYQKIHNDLYTDYALACKSNRFQADLKYLVSCQFLEKRKTSYRIAKACPTMYQNSYKHISDVVSLIDLLGFSFTDKKNLFHIQKILKGALTQTSSRTNDSYLTTVGGNSITYTSLANVRKKLDGVDYINHALEITYPISKNSDELEQFLFQTRLLYYSYELDSFYFIGNKIVDQEHFSDTILNLEYVEEIHESATVNSQYCNRLSSNSVLSKAYQNSLYSFSLDKPFEVEIEFDLSDDSNGFYRQLLIQFEQARLDGLSYKQELFYPAVSDVSNTKIVYKDSLNNLHELANFLRRFGERVTVISPQSLSDKRAESAQRALTRYGILD